MTSADLPDTFLHWLKSEIRNDVTFNLIVSPDASLGAASGTYCPPLSQSAVQISAFEAGGAKLLKACASDFAMQFDVNGDTEALTSHVAGCSMDSFWNRKVTASSGGLGLRSVSEFFASMFIVAQRTRPWRRKAVLPPTGETIGNTGPKVKEDEGGEALIGRLLVGFFLEAARERLYLRHLPYICGILFPGERIKDISTTLARVEEVLSEKSSFILGEPTLTFATKVHRGKSGEEEEDVEEKLIPENLLNALGLEPLQRWGLSSLSKLVCALQSPQSQSSWTTSIDAPQTALASSFTFGVEGCEVSVSVRGEKYNIPCRATGSKGALAAVRRQVQQYNANLPTENKVSNETGEHLYFLRCVLGSLLEKVLIYEGRVYAQSIKASTATIGAMPGSIEDIKEAATSHLCDPFRLSGKDAVAHNSYVFSAVKHILRFQDKTYFGLVDGALGFPTKDDAVSCQGWIPTRLLVAAVNSMMKKGEGSKHEELLIQRFSGRTKKKGASQGNTTSEGGVLFPNARPVTEMFIETLLSEHDVLQRFEVSNPSDLPEIDKPYIHPGEGCCRSMYAHNTNQPLFESIYSSFEEITSVEALTSNVGYYLVDGIKNFRSDIQKHGALRLFDNCSFITVLSRDALEKTVTPYFAEGKQLPGSKFDEKIRTNQEQLEFLEVDMVACVKASCVKVIRLRERTVGDDTIPGCFVIIPQMSGHKCFPLSLFTQSREVLSMKNSTAELKSFFEPFGPAYQADRKKYFPDPEMVFGHRTANEAEIPEYEGTDGASPSPSSSGPTELFEFNSSSWERQLQLFGETESAIKDVLLIPKRPFTLTKDSDGVEAVKLGQFTEKHSGMRRLKALISENGFVHTNENYTTGEVNAEGEGGSGESAPEALVPTSSSWSRETTTELGAGDPFFFTEATVSGLPAGLEFTRITVSKPTVSDSALNKIAAELGLVVTTQEEPSNENGGVSVRVQGGRFPPSLPRDAIRMAVTRECHGVDNYERLEFIGDAILDYIVVHDAIAVSQGWTQPPSSANIPPLPKSLTGRLETRKGQIGDLKTVVMDVCRNAALQFIVPPSLAAYFDEQTKIRSIETNLKVKADMVEAIVGAVYEAKLGLDGCRYVISNLYQNLIRGADGVNNKMFDRCPYTIFQNLPRNMPLRSLEMFHTHAEYACQLFGGAFDCTTCVRLPSDKTINSLKETPDTPSPKVCVRASVNSHAASVGFPRIQDKSYATHFTTGPVYAYRRCDDLNYSLIHGAIFRELYYGGVAFVNETIPENERDPLTTFTIDFDGCPVSLRNADREIAKFLRKKFGGREGRGLVLDCSGVSVVTGKYKHSCHVHFPSLRLPLSHLATLTEELRGHLSVSTQPPADTSQFRTGDFVRCGKRLGIVLVPPQPPTNHIGTLPFSLFYEVCAFLDDEQRLRCYFANAPLRRACTRYFSKDHAGKSYVRFITLQAKKATLDPFDGASWVIPTHVQSEKDIVGCEGLETEGGARSIYQETLKSYQDKNPNHSLFWERVVDSGLVTSKKLRSALCDKWDTVYGQEYRPLYFERYIGLDEAKQDAPPPPSPSSSSGVTVAVLEGDDGSEYVDDNEDGWAPHFETFSPESPASKEATVVSDIPSISLIELTSLRLAKAFSPLGALYYPHSGLGQNEATAATLPSAQDVLLRQHLPQCNGDRATVLKGGCTLRGVSEDFGSGKVARYAALDPISIITVNKTALCPALGLRFSTANTDGLATRIATLTSPHVTIIGQLTPLGQQVCLSSLNGEMAGSKGSRTVAPSGPQQPLLLPASKQIQPRPAPTVAVAGGPGARSSHLFQWRHLLSSCRSGPSRVSRLSALCVQDHPDADSIYAYLRAQARNCKSKICVIFFDSARIMEFYQDILDDGLGNKVELLNYADLLESRTIHFPFAEDVFVAESLGEAKPLFMWQPDNCELAPFVGNTLEPLFWTRLRYAASNVLYLACGKDYRLMRGLDVALGLLPPNDLI